MADYLWLTQADYLWLTTQIPRFLNDNGYLNNTILIIMADHGHRFEAIRSTE